MSLGPTRKWASTFICVHLRFSVRYRCLEKKGNHLALWTQVAQDGCESIYDPFAKVTSLAALTSVIVATAADSFSVMMIMNRFIDQLIRSDAVEMGSARALACGVPRPYVFTGAAGILPAVEPGILPGGNGVLSGKALVIWRPRPGGKMLSAPIRHHRQEQAP